MQTYNQIIKLNNQFSDNHKILKTFGNGKAYDIVLHNQEEWFKYPVMWMEDLPHPLNQNEFTYSFRVYFIAQVANLTARDGDNMLTNENEVKSDMIECAKDLLSFWAQDTTYSDLDLVKSGNITTITDKLADRITGCYVDLKLKQGFRYNKCAIPMVGIDPPPSETCQDATETFNGSSITSIPSGGNKDIIVRNDADTPVQVGTIITDTSSSLIIEVPEGVENIRLYPLPNYTGAIDRGADYDTYWRKANNIGNLNQNTKGIMMRRAFGSQSVLDVKTPNVFNNLYVYTGTTGGYLDWDTGIYYDVDDNVTTRELAYPDGLAVNHVESFLFPIDQDGTTKMWQEWMDDGQTLTIGAYTGWYLPSIIEMATLGNWGVLFGYNNPPLFNWGSGLKFTSDTYPAGTTQAMVAQSFSHFTSRSKTSASKAIYIKYVDINAEFGT